MERRLFAGDDDRSKREISPDEAFRTCCWSLPYKDRGWAVEDVVKEADGCTLLAVLTRSFLWWDPGYDFRPAFVS